MRKVAILLGSWAHQRSTITWKNLEPRYHPIVIAAKNCYAKSDVQIETRRLLAVRDIVGRIPKLRYRFGWGADQYLFGLGKALEDVDIVLSSSPTCLFSYQAANYCRKTGKPLVLQEIENIPFLDFNRKVYPYRKVALETAKFISPATKRAELCLHLERVEKERTRIIPFGIDVDFFHPQDTPSDLRSQLGYQKDDLIVLFTGRAVWEKGIHVFIDAAKTLLDRCPSLPKPLKFLLLSRGVEIAEARKRIEYLKLGDKMKITGSVPYDRMPDLYNTADVVVVPSIPTRPWQEQWGLVISEAMACGTPVISALSGSIPEVVGDCGLLANPGDTLSLADQMERMICDDDLRRDMGIRGCQRVRDLYDYRKINTLWADLLDEALESR